MDDEVEFWVFKCTFTLHRPVVWERNGNMGESGEKTSGDEC